MTSIQSLTVLNEDQCTVMCYNLGKGGCTAYAFEEPSLLCELFLADLTTTDIMPL